VASPARKFRDQVQNKYPGSVVIERGRNFIKHQTPGGLNVLDTSIGPIHYGVSEDQEIDTAWQVGQGVWDYEIVTNDFHAFINDSVPVTYRYLDVASGEDIEITVTGVRWVNDEGASEAAASFVQVIPTINDDRLIWNDIAPGWSVEVEAQTARLVKYLTIDSLANLGAPSIGGTNQRLQLQFSLAKSSGLEIWLDGNKWDEKNNTQIETDGDIWFRQESGGASVFWFRHPTVIQVDDKSNGPIIQRLKKVGVNLLAEIDIPWSWLQSASFPIVIDPTVDPQVGASADDTVVWPGTCNYTGTIGYLGNDGSYNSIGNRFTVNVPQNSTVTTSYITLTAQAGASNDTVRLEIAYEDTNDPGDFTSCSEASFNARTRSSSPITWDFTTDWVQDSEYNSPSLNNLLEALFAEAYWASGEHAVIFVEDDGSDTNALRYCYLYDGSTTKCALLHIEYDTAGDLSASTSDGLTLGESMQSVASLGNIDVALDNANYQGRGVRII